MRRLTDRIRPWRAPVAPPGAPQVAVLGAGAAGLASAAMLRCQGLNVVVHDRNDEVGGSWPTRYDALRLNTVRWMSDLPGRRMPSALGRWVTRDAVTSYLREYAAWHGLEVRPNTTIDRIDSAPDGRWALTEEDGTVRIADAVVVATGHSRRARVPDWPGIDSFRGEMLHSAAYVNAEAFAGRRIGVVGAGSSGGEIVVDLATSGCEVVWSVRSAPRVFPREAAGVPVTPMGPIADVMPDALVDRVAPWLERAVYGRRDYLPEPPAPMMRLLAACKEPMTADGIVELVRSGAVEVVPAVDRLTGSGMRLAGGRTIDVDAVIAATGYDPDLEGMVGHLDVLGPEGRPRSLSPRPGLAFVGFRIPLTGTLWAVESDARRSARALGRTLGVGSSPPGVFRRRSAG